MDFEDIFYLYYVRNIYINMRVLSNLTNYLLLPCLTKLDNSLILLLSRWFKNVDWEEVYYKQLKPPIVPKVSYEGDTRNFDDYPETDWRQVPGVSDREYRMFEDF